MPNYPTYDAFADLTRIERLTARPLFLKAVTDPQLKEIYENGALYSNNAQYGERAPLFFFSGTAGATYGVASTSHFDPDGLRVYDGEGRTIAQDTGGSDEGTDLLFFVAPYSGVYYVNAAWSQGPTLAYWGSALAVYEDLDTAPKKNVIAGTPDDDTIDDTESADIVDGGSGVDTFSVFWPREEYTVEIKDDVVLLSHRDYPYVVDELTNIERIWFTDGYISFETEGFVAEAYRLYQAAFDRQPDEEGLGFWIRNMSDGMSLYTVADAFLRTEEFATLYGQAPSSEDIVTRLYANILDRTPDQEGFDHWVGLLDSGLLEAAEVLVAFSESVENTLRTFDDMDAGYFFYY